MSKALKNISTLAADAPFLDLLAEELWRRVEGDGFQLSKYIILLPTRRACRALGASFARLAKGAPVLLPRMRPLGEVDEDEITFADEENFGISPAISPLKRLMLLTQQVQRRDPSLSWDQAAQGAEALARFLDQIQIEQCDIDMLPALVEEQELAQHWQQILQFLEIVTRNWPLILKDIGVLDPAQRRNLLQAAQAAAWRKSPPSFPVIAAGSTGSIPATADLLDVIASLPRGEVILPGLDQILDNDAWSKIEDTHPQYNMKRLLEKMDVEREAVRNFAPHILTTPRLKLLSEAMRPASSTDVWRRLREDFDRDAVKGLHYLTLDHPQEEAQVIALRLRALLEEEDKTATFVTSDRGLATRVSALLRRWDIAVDDSGGAPLSTLPLGAFLNLLLEAAAPHAGTVDLLALLKHPLAACGTDVAQCRAAARTAELRVRRNEVETFDAVCQLLAQLTKNRHKLLSLSDHIDAHIQTAEALARSDTQSGADRLWRGDIGEETASFLNEWRAGADGFPALTGADYAALFHSLSSTKILRVVRDTHPRLSILGPLEARLIHSDLIILGGLNEGVWPPDVGFDPWMSRPMRKKFKLPAPEFRIGLSAHDFAQLAASPQVLMTRSSRSAGVPTVPSRFLLQIDTVLKAAGLQNALNPQENWRGWADKLDTPLHPPKACAPPEPRPPIDLRPTSLSVTDIGVWLRNPYAIYARHILNLKKLEELDVELDASDRGTMIHEALEKFLSDYPVRLPDNAEEKLLEIGEEIFKSDTENPRVHAFWWARFVDIAAWFVSHERQRRISGIMPVKAEAKGTTQIGLFTLRGRADRIDRLPTGEISISDYKTGACPSNADVKSGIEPQLSLLAMIAAQGGFKEMAAAQSGSLDYWILKGGRDGCEVRSFQKEISDLVRAAEAGLKDLIRTFADPSTPYEAAPKPRLSPRCNDYAHLSRLAEWGRVEEP